jgi:stress-induced morphogen
MKNSININLKNFKKFCSQCLNREGRIKNILQSKIKNISHFELINESSLHSVPKGSETHFKVIVVSDEFENKTQIEKHKIIYALLKDEMGEKKDNKLHALSIIAKSPKEWSQEKENVKKQKSPPCINKKI